MQRVNEGWRDLSVPRLRSILRGSILEPRRSTYPQLLTRCRIPGPVSGHATFLLLLSEFVNAKTLQERNETIF